MAQGVMELCGLEVVQETLGGLNNDEACLYGYQVASGEVGAFAQLRNNREARFHQANTTFPSSY